ncbi:MAG: ABC transporter, partial [Eubacteriales bacterium]|nr:ABC transporter [Eubacteriales bacterium]
ILDEPTTGLDPQTRKNIWSVVHELRVKEKMTVFLTTHYMEETADADNIIVIDHGKIAAEGTPLDLKNRYAGDYITFYNAEADEDEIRGLGLPVDRVGSGVYRLKVSGSKEAAGLVCSRPDLFKDFEITKGKMDDVFLAITGEQLTGDEK